MRERLNTLKENKNEVLTKIKKLDTSKTTKKWDILYGIGYIGVIVATITIFYPNEVLLIPLFTVGYGISVPVLKVVLDNKKIRKLRKKLTTIDKELEGIQKEIQNQRSTNSQEPTLEITSKTLKITEETILSDYPKLNRDETMSPSIENKKGYTRKKRR